MRDTRLVMITVLLIFVAVCLVACVNDPVDLLEGYGAGEYYNASEIVYEMKMQEDDIMLSSISTHYTRIESGMNVLTVTTTLNQSAEGDPYVEESINSFIALDELKDKLPCVKTLSKDLFLNEQYKFEVQGQITTISFTPASAKDFLGLSDDDAERVEAVAVEVTYQEKNPTLYMATFMLGDNQVEMKITYTY